MKMCSMSLVWFQICIALVGKHLLDMDMMAFPPGLSTLRISLNTWGRSHEKEKKKIVVSARVE